MAQPDLDTLPGQTIATSPTPRGVRVYDALAAASAEFLVEEITGSTDAQGVWLSFMADQPFYLIWGQVGAVPAPDPAARFSSAPAVADAQCLRIPADYEYMRKISKKFSPAFRLLRAGASDAVVRVERVSIIFGRPTLL